MEGKETEKKYIGTNVTVGVIDHKNNMVALSVA